MIQPHQIIEIACTVTNVTPNEHIYGSKQSNIIASKCIASYLLHHRLDMSSHEIAELYDTKYYIARDRFVRIEQIKDKKFKSVQDQLFNSWLKEAELIIDNNHF